MEVQEDLYGGSKFTQPLKERENPAKHQLVLNKTIWLVRFYCCKHQDLW